MTKEPAAVAAIAVAVINAVVLIVLKRDLSIEEQTAIATVTVLVAGFFTRSKVTPVA